MRVLHMIPDIGVANGVMSVILNYAKAMDGIVFDVVYFHESDETREDDIKALGGRVFKIDKPSPTDLFSHKLDALFSEHEGEWDAVHIHAPHFAVFIAPAAKRAGIKKICVHCHTTEFSLKGNSSRNKLLSLYAKFCVKDKFACSKKAGQMWYGNKSFVVINNAIDFSKYTFDESKRDTVRNDLGVEDSFVVGHIGRTDIPQKNHGFILEVFSKLKVQKPNAKLLLIGGERTDELTSLATELQIDNDIIYLGFRNDVADLLQACDVFLFPSTSEGLPVSVVEAQASGLPVFMSDVITNEVCLTELVKTMSLSDSADSWALAIANSDGQNRKSPIINNWDINYCGKQLAEYYKN